MLNRYQGNTGRVTRVDDGQGKPAVPLQRPPAQDWRPPSRAGSSFGLFDRLSGLLPEKLESLSELETDDIILLLILYLMYRESGDSELLIIMGAMFLL